jgi:hypothetical protein
MTPATVARQAVERAIELSAAQTRGKLDAAPTLEMLLAHPPVADGLACCTRLDGRRVVILAALAVGRSLLPMWERAFPGQTEPAVAVAASEVWVAEPSDANADAAARAAEAAIRAGLRAWHGSHRPAAWAARVAAWVAMAPKYGWPAVAALSGACEVVPVEQVVAAVAEGLAVAGAQAPNTALQLTGER